MVGSSITMYLECEAESSSYRRGGERGEYQKAGITCEIAAQKQPAFSPGALSTIYALSAGCICWRFFGLVRCAQRYRIRGKFGQFHYVAVGSEKSILAFFTGLTRRSQARSSGSVELYFAPRKTQACDGRASSGCLCC